MGSSSTSHSLLVGSPSQPVPGSIDSIGSLLLKTRVCLVKVDYLSSNDAITSKMEAVINNVARLDVEGRAKSCAHRTDKASTAWKCKKLSLLVQKSHKKTRRCFRAGKRQSTSSFSVHVDVDVLRSNLLLLTESCTVSEGIMW